ncbi:MAG: TerC family protein [Micropepsaceae bacterium]
MDQSEFWLSVGQIVWINILLSGDNAVIIALACRSLTGRTRTAGMTIGAGVAVFLRVIFTGTITSLLSIPFLKVVGAAALVYIAVDLIKPKSNDEEVKLNAAETLWRAVATIVIADLIMSLDNVIAIAAVAHGSWLFLVIGLGLSVPMIISGSFLISAVLDRAPVVVWAGACLLGWIAGDMFASDVAISGQADPALVKYYARPAALIGTAIVLALGLLLNHGSGKTRGTGETDG